MRTEFKLIIITFSMFFVSCGKSFDIDKELLELMNVPNQQYELALESYLKDDLDFQDTEVYEGSLHDVQNACKMENIIGCANGQQNVIAVHSVQNCKLMMHEFLHLALYQLTGSGDPGHEHELFSASSAGFFEMCRDYIW